MTALRVVSWPAPARSPWPHAVHAVGEASARAACGARVPDRLTSIAGEPGDITCGRCRGEYLEWTARATLQIRTWTPEARPRRCHAQPLALASSPCGARARWRAVIGWLEGRTLCDAHRRRAEGQGRTFGPGPGRGRIRGAPVDPAAGDRPA